MTPENLGALVHYRLEQAQEALRDAQLLLGEGSPRAAVNRSYYAMFYAVLALLASRQEETSKHSGVIALFNRLYVKNGRFSKNFSKWLRRGFDLRTRCDYAPMVAVSAEEAAELMSHAVEFVARVAEELKTMTDDGPELRRTK